MGADRALKRLALQRVRDVDLWEAPLVRVGESAAEARGKLADSEVPYPLLVDDEGRPLGWLSERALAGERITDELRSRADPVHRDWTTSCATRSPTCSPRRRSTAPVVDERGAVTGVLSIEILSHALKTDPEEVPSGADAL